MFRPANRNFLGNGRGLFLCPFQAKAGAGQAWAWQGQAVETMNLVMSKDRLILRNFVAAAFQGFCRENATCDVGQKTKKKQTILMGCQFHSSSTSNVDKDANTYLKGLNSYNRRNVVRAVEAIQDSDTLLITAGAGMGVDSGLPDFRGPQGLWKDYPPLKERGLTLPGVSTPQWFHDDPEFAWGFFGHRYNMYKQAEPHEGFQILKKWTEKMTKGYFVYTSNVDGHFQRAGFPEDNVMECHGSINYMQCVDSEKFPDIWPIPPSFEIEVDEKTLRAKKPLPLGPGSECLCLARPNTRMFKDREWVGFRTYDQEERFRVFKKGLKYAKLAVIEMGAGLAVPTVRIMGEGNLERSIVKKGVLIRINTREPDVPDEDENISIELGALAALKIINGLLHEKGWI